MKAATFMLILSIPVLNIAIHAAIKNAIALAGGSFTGSFFSYGFLLASSLCAILAVCLLGLYSSGITLSRAILFMGVISILGGSLFGVVYLGEHLNRVEWLLFANLFLLLTYRFFLT